MYRGCKPSKFVGVWWEMHLEKSTWGSGAKHGATTANTRRYIDFAAKNGFRGVLVEGWNLGWDGNWSAADRRSASPSVSRLRPAATSAYAISKGVRLIGHHETGGNVARYEQQMDAAYQLYARHGVDSIKSGYVTDAGTAQFPGPAAARTSATPIRRKAARHYLKAVTEAARYKLAIDTHEPIKDTGLRRTYPNWVSREGARGMEYNAWGNPINSVDHEVNLIFTRMLSGPMDYTPGILSLEGVKGKPINSTQAKQLASFVVIYSPVVMAADLIENYEKYPGPFKFIKDVPTDWSDTQVIHGEMGEYATIARKDRHSDDWYVGSVTDGSARTLSLPLASSTPASATPPKSTATANKPTTAPATASTSSSKRRSSPPKRRLQLKLAPGGGQAIRLSPVINPGSDLTTPGARSTISTCDLTPGKCGSGNTSSVRAVDERMPPMTTVASGRWTSAPVPVAMAIGMKPSDATRAVISTGRRLPSEPSRIACSTVRPSSRSLRMKEISTSPFSTATPDSAMKPTAADIDSGMPSQRQRGDAARQRERYAAEDQQAILQIAEHREQQHHHQRQRRRHHDLQAPRRRLQLLELSAPGGPVARRDRTFCRRSASSTNEPISRPRTLALMTTRRLPSLPADLVRTWRDAEARHFAQRNEIGGAASARGSGTGNRASASRSLRIDSGSRTTMSKRRSPSNIVPACGAAYRRGDGLLDVADIEAVARGLAAIDIHSQHRQAAGLLYLDFGGAVHLAQHGGDARRRFHSAPPCRRRTA
jgi:hypothetical protein